MKKGKRHILYACILMICFVAGQWAVYAHYHPVSKITTASARALQSRASVSDKCQLCDAMHHHSMVQESYTYFASIVTTDHIYKQGRYDFISISLVLAAGRAPPIS